MILIRMITTCLLLEPVPGNQCSCLISEARGWGRDFSGPPPACPAPPPAYSPSHQQLFTRCNHVLNISEFMTPSNPAQPYLFSPWPRLLEPAWNSCTDGTNIVEINWLIIRDQRQQLGGSAILFVVNCGCNIWSHLYIIKNVFNKSNATILCQWLYENIWCSDWLVLYG